MFLNSLSDSNEKLANILNLLDWSRGFKVSTFRKKHRSAVVDTVIAKNLSREFDSETLLYYMPKEEAIKLAVKSNPFDESVFSKTISFVLSVCRMECNLDH